MTLLESPIIEIESIDNSLNGQLEVLRQHALKVERFLDYAKSYEVVSNWSAEEALTIAAEAKSLYKRIEDARKELTEEPRKRINKVNDTAKIFTEKLKEVENIIKVKIQNWKATLEAKNKEAEEAALALTESLGLDISVHVDKTPKYVRGQGAMTYEKTDWVFSVEDLSMIPREYLTIDEQKIKAALKMGVREIPGLKIFSEQKTIIKTR